jgi:putative aldouronate transport system permease protein
MSVKVDSPQPAANVKRKVGFIREISTNKYLYLLALPGLLFFLVFNYLPMAGLYIAFLDFNPIAGLFGFGSKFVGLQNFKFFFTSSDWLFVTFNTLFLNFLFITTGLVVQIFLAVGLNELGNKKFKRISQTFMYLPNFLSWTVISLFSTVIFGTDGGLLNNLLSALGLPGINFYQEPSLWPGLLVALRIWKGAGFGTVIFLSTISSIDHEIYEAAVIDGASRLQSIMRITIPMLRKTTVMLLILAVGWIFYGDFGMIYALVGDNPMLRSTTDVIDTFVYRALRMNNDYGMSSAVGLFQSAVGFVMVIGANAAAKMLDRDSALF